MIVKGRDLTDEHKGKPVRVPTSIDGGHQGVLIDYDATNDVARIRGDGERFETELLRAGHLDFDFYQEED